MTSYTDGDAKWWFDEIPVTGGQFYDYSDYYQSTAPLHSVVVQFKYANATVSYLELGRLAQRNTWQRFERQFSVPAGATSMTIFHALHSVGTLTVDQFGLRVSCLPSGDTFDKGYVTLSFDDGWTSHKTTVKPMLDAAGYKGTFYIVTNEMKNASQEAQNDPNAYMTTANVLSMHQGGHEVSPHTRTHRSLIAIPAAEVESEVRGSRDDLIAAGITPADTFAYTYGEYNASTIQTVQNAGYVGARSVGAGFATPVSPRFELPVQNVLNTTTVSQMQNWIDTALANKTWLILVFHQVDEQGFPYDTRPGDLQAVVNYLRQRQASVITMKQGIGMLR